MTQKELEKLFVDIAKRNKTAENMIDDLRSLESCGEISSDDYDYLTKNWDSILEKHNLM